MELAIPGSAVRHTFVVRHITSWATWPVVLLFLGVVGGGGGGGAVGSVLY